MDRKTHTINAEGKVFGRLATEVAGLLRGKNKISFQPNKDEGDVVMVYNTDLMRATGKKMEQKIYWRHSGYLGHVRLTPLKKLFKKDSRQVLERAVMGMLPKNRLRAKMIHRLKLYRGHIE